MNTEMVTPSHLHRDLESARNGNTDYRLIILISVFGSENLAVIRRIPEIMSPLSGEEKVMVAQWAEGLTKNQDVSKRDFAFHLMVNCKVPAERIISALERNRTFSRSALEHIQQTLQENGSAQDLDEYLLEVAETLLKGTEISPRDRGRHMLMTLARDEEDWRCLAFRFSIAEVSDLRQGVLERFLEECRDVTALTTFVDNVVKICLDAVSRATVSDVHKRAPYMHWVLMCLERLDRKAELSRAAAVFQRKFGNALPHSLRYKIQSLAPKVSVQGSTRANGPDSIEEALRNGWTIRTQSGRQVVLVKDGRSITKYRS